MSWGTQGHPRRSCAPKPLMWASSRSPECEEHLEAFILTNVGREGLDPMAWSDSKNCLSAPPPPPRALRRRIRPWTLQHRGRAIYFHLHRQVVSIGASLSPSTPLHSSTGRRSITGGHGQAVLCCSRDCLLHQFLPFLRVSYPLSHVCAWSYLCGACVLWGVFFWGRREEGGGVLQRVQPLQA